MTFLEKNHGVLIDKRHSDFIAGTLPYQVIRADGDWRKDCPIGENQFDLHVDFMDCVTFSALNSLEIQNSARGWGIVNLSDRFTAKMSGTTLQGNYQYKVADSIRNDGVVFESVYPMSAEDTWDIYYQTIPAEVVAQKFKVDISYEWIFTSQQEATLDALRYHLKHAPIQITIPGTHPNHAVVLVYIDAAGTLYYFDSYPGGDYFKTTTMLPATAMKLVLNQPLNGQQMTSFQVQAGTATDEDKRVGVAVDYGNFTVITWAKDQADLDYLIKRYAVDTTKPIKSLV